MRINMDKVAFIAKLENRIERRVWLMDYYNRVFLPTLQKFHGKVYNRRFVQALQDCADELTYVRDFDNDHIVIERRSSRYNYTDYEDLYVMVKLGENKRIDADASITNDLGKAWVTNFQQYTEELRSTINDYDKCMGIAEGVRDAIMEYSKLPSAFRENIEFRYKFYL